MATFILTWNPDLWTWEDDDDSAKIQSTAAGLRVTDRWSVGVRRGGIEVGDRAFLLRQQRDRGIVASGEFTSTVCRAPHWDGTGRDAPCADVEWDTVVEPDAGLPTEALMVAIPTVHWNRMYGSGVEIPDDAATVLEQLWAVEANLYRSPEELPVSRDFIEGGVTRVEVNRYERDPQAREACLHHWGYRCSVCDVSMEEQYGEIGHDFINVHHLVELSTLGAGYRVDPVADFKPVCPNRHTMLHRRRPAFRIEELRERRYRRVPTSGRSEKGGPGARGRDAEKRDSRPHRRRQGGEIARRGGALRTSSRLRTPDRVRKGRPLCPFRSRCRPRLD